jgi:hypothetical protein
MNDDRDWKQLADAWRTGAETASPSSDEIRNVGIESRRAERRRILVLVAALAAIALITTLCLLRRSIEGYTFAVIGWSALLPLGGYIIALQERGGDLTLATTDAFGKRSNQLAKTIQLLEFARVLLGVETIICIGFWITLRHGNQNYQWIALLIALCGGALYATLGWVLANIRKQHASMTALAKTFGSLE